MKISKALVGLLSSVLPIVGCAAQIESSPLGEPGTFAIKEVASEGTSVGLKKTWLATGTDESGKSPCQFRLEMWLKPLSGPAPPFAFSKAAILREKGNDGGPFLRRLAKRLGAKSIPKTSTKADRLDMSIVILGNAMSRQFDELGSGFKQVPAGDWTVTKAFFGSGDAEVFLNLNPKLGVAEFSPKDPEYGDRVVAELARIFLP